MSYVVTLKESVYYIVTLKICNARYNNIKSLAFKTQLQATRR